MHHDTNTPSKWDIRFLDLANLVASWSKDPSTQVGCAIVRPDRTVASLGYNGFPRGVHDDAERYADRSTKYLLVKHAEENAVLAALEPLKGCTAYVTHSPCASCTGTMIQAGIVRIVTRKPPPGLAERYAESFVLAAQMRREAGIAYLEIDSQ